MADNKYWAALAMEKAQTGFISDHILTLEPRRYEAAKARALSYGIYTAPAADIALRESPEDIYELSCS